MTIEDLANEFYSNYMVHRLRPSTCRGYMVNINNHILPYLGTVRLDELTVEDLDELTVLLTSHLSNKSIIYVHATFRRMLVYAMKRSYIHKTPYSAFDLPRAERYRRQVWNETQIRTALLLVKGWKIEVPVTLALAYGLRRGECLGIDPLADLDVVNNILHVQRTRGMEFGHWVTTPCKTESSNRFILLRPQHTRMLLDAAPYGGYAYTLTPARLDSTFQAFCDWAELPRIRFHDLRHSFGQFMYDSGVDIKTLKDVMGHSSVAVTDRLYVRPSIAAQKKLLDIL